MKRLITSKDLDMFRTNENAVKNALRENRTKFFEAFDIYEKNVTRGRITETQEEKATIDIWYNAALDLQEWACMIDGVPNKIVENTNLKKYVKAVQ